jgi:hypothetical protein
MMHIGTAMNPDTLYRLAPTLITLQFAAFGWRVHRELNLGYAERGTFVLLPDVLNIMSLFAAVICLIVLPIATDTYFWLSKTVLAGGYVLIAFHPFTLATHYRLWSREGKSRSVTDRKDYPYATGEELVSSLLSVVLAVLAAAYIGTH